MWFLELWVWCSMKNGRVKHIYIFFQKKGNWKNSPFSIKSSFSSNKILQEKRTFYELFGILFLIPSSCRSWIKKESVKYFVPRNIKSFELKFYIKSGMEKRIIRITFIFLLSFEVFANLIWIQPNIIFNRFHKSLLSDK